VCNDFELLKVAKTNNLLIRNALSQSTAMLIQLQYEKKYHLGMVFEPNTALSLTLCSHPHPCAVFPYYTHGSALTNALMRKVN